MIALVVAFAVFQLYPLDICYGYGDRPDVDDIVQAILIMVPSHSPDSEAWMATLPHGLPPAIPAALPAALVPSASTRLNIQRSIRLTGSCPWCNKGAASDIEPRV